MQVHKTRPDEPDTEDGWQGRRPFVVAAAVVASTVATVAVLLSFVGLDEGGRRVLSDGCFVLCSLAATAATARAAMRSAGRLRLAWTLLAGNAVAWTVGNSYWFYYQNIASVQPFPTEADVFYAMAIVFGAAGLLSFPTGRRGLSDRLRSLLDAVIITTILLAASSSLVLHSVWVGSAGGKWSAAALLIPPIGDVVLASLAMMLLARAQPGSRLHLAVVGLAYLVYAFSDSTYAYQGALGTFAIGSPLDLGWISGYLLLGLAALAPSATRAVSDRLVTVPAPLISSIMVYTALMIALVASSLNPNPSRDTATRALGLLALVLFGFRQVLLAWDNSRLQRELEAKVIERTRELHNLASRSERIVASVADGIYGVDVHGRVIFVNPAATELLACAERELIGASAHDRFHAHEEAVAPDALAVRCNVVLALTTGEVVRDVDTTYRRGDGSSFPLESTISPIIEDGAITGAVIAFRDTTERREVDRMKNEFISVVSHELRTPLTSIRGSLGLVSSGKLGALPAAADRMVAIALQSSERLTRLINDILDLERVASGAIPLELATHSAADLLGPTAAALGPVADESGVRLTVEPSDARVHADADRLIQTLTNLVGNAVKFSPTGGTVTLAARTDAQMVEFSVTDEGRGVPADKFEAIFERFQQVDSSDARDKGGTGLGLAICRTIVERHGGRIWVESRPGRGSTFRFTVPSGLDRLPATRPDDAASGAPVVLVVDDDTSILAMLAEVLQQRGLRVITVADARDALGLALAERPSALVIDLRMPGMTGKDLLGQLHGHPATVDIPVVVLSVLPPTEEPELAALVTDWVTKPSNDEAISAAVLHAVAQSADPRVLVVEDDDDLAAVLLTMLSRHGVRVDRAGTEEEAIAMSRPTPPDVIVLDLELPDGDGSALVSALRASIPGTPVPIVVYSAADVSAADRQALQLGNTEFLTKSRVPPEEVERRVVALMDRLIDHRVDRPRIAMGPVR
ncbi:MAG TPA: response regulator [Pilimelia sp.]|nr:response regulator [Pilimelia sp.]